MTRCRECGRDFRSKQSAAHAKLYAEVHADLRKSAAADRADATIDLFCERIERHRIQSNEFKATGDWMI